jgi:cytoskeletal protein CcmA (bactofilin family)
LFRRTQRPEADAIEVIIGPRATFSGTLQCDASIRVDGAVDQGRLVTPANVILTESANVQCDIIAKTVSIRGQFNGVIQADRVEMLDGSQVQGVLNVNSFYMDERAVLRAAVNIRGDAAGMVQRPQPPQQPSIPVVPPLPAPNAAQPSAHTPAQNTVHNSVHNTAQTMPSRGADDQ